MPEFTAAAQQDEDLLRVLAENPSNVVALYDTAGRRVYSSPSAEQLLGAVPDDPFAGVHADDIQAARDVWTRLLAGERTNLTFRYCRPDGRWLWLEAWSSRVEYRGAPHVLAIVRDVTDRARARDEVAAREARFRALVEHNDALITIVNDQGRPLYASPSYSWILGYTPEELLSWPDLWPVVHPDDLAWVQEQFAQILRQPIVRLPRPLRALTKDGRVRHVALTLTDGRNDPAVGGVIGNGRDVTEELILNEQLRQAQKMEAVGQLAGGVAHDFNNLLTIITAYGAMLRADLPPGARADVDEMLAAADRAVGLTRQLLAFGRRQMIQPRVVGLNETVATTSCLLRRVIGEDITLRTQLAPNLWPVHADPSQLEQVVMNLAVNARDAMPQGGTLQLSTGNVSVTADAAADRPGLVQGQYVVLTVEDTGTGIEPALLPHLFEPFFTTKGPGKGSGLGLSTVYGIVKQSRGYVYADSTPGQGSRFAVYLPRHMGPAEQTAPPTTPVAPRGTETILLVEDDPSVRTATRRMLERQGYRVIETADGAEALRRVADGDLCGERVDLVLTDVVMPEQGGRELGERLAEQRPRLKILYMSGYTDDEIIRRGLIVSGAPFLEKPFTPARLAEVVRQALDDPRFEPRS